MPAATRRLARVAVTGDTRRAHTFEPPVVTRPSRSTRSLSAMGTPCRAPPVARANGLVGCFRSKASVGFVDGDVRVQVRIAVADAFEQRVDGIDRRQRSGRERAR